MIKILFTDFYVDENTLYFNEDSGNVVFTCNGMGILNIDLNNINFDNTNYDENDPDVKILQTANCMINYLFRIFNYKRGLTL